MRALTVKMETVTLIGKGTWNLTSLCNKCRKLTVKYYFLADILFLGVVLNFNKYIFPWQTCFMLEVVYY
jgi:hypothetical protein